MSILHDALKRLDKKGKKAPESEEATAVEGGTSQAAVSNQGAADAETEFASTLVDSQLDHLTELDVTVIDTPSEELTVKSAEPDELEMSSTRRDVRLDEMSGMGETVFMRDTSILDKQPTVADTLSENSFVLFALVLMLMSVGVLVYYFTEDSVFDVESIGQPFEAVQRAESTVELAVETATKEPPASAIEPAPVAATTIPTENEALIEPQSVARLTEGSNESPTSLVEAGEIDKQEEPATVDTEKSVQAAAEAEDVATLTSGTASKTKADSVQSSESTEVGRLTEPVSSSVAAVDSEDVALLTRDVASANKARSSTSTSEIAEPKPVAVAAKPVKDSEKVEGAVDKINTSLVLSEQGQLSEQRFHLRSAYESYRKAHSVDPSNPQFLTDLGRVSAKLNEYEASRRWINQLPRSEQGWEQAFWLGFGYLNEQKPELAVEYFEQATRSDPQQAAVWLYLGLAQQQLGQFNQSIDSFHSARAMASDLPEIAYNTGISWMALGQRPKARAAFEHFLKATDQNPSYYVNQRERVIRQYLR